MNQKYNHLLKYGFQDTISDNLRSTSNTYRVSKNGDDTYGNGSLSKPFATIKKAVDTANLVASISNPIAIFIESGEYIEDSFTVNSYIFLVGETQDSVIIKPSDPNLVLINVSDVAGISFVTIVDVTNNAAMVINNAQENVLIHKVYFENCYTSIRMLATLTECYPYLEYVSVDNPIYTAFEVITTTNYCEVSAENSYVYSVTNQSAYAEVVSDGANSMFIYHTGSSVNQFNVGSGKGFYSLNGGSFKLRNLQVEGYEYGISAINGVGANLKITSCTFSDNVYNFHIDGQDITGYFTGYSEYEKYYIHPDSLFFITNVDSQIITVAKKGGNFLSVADAIDSITDNSLNKIYTIKIGSGVFVEDTITMKPYVNIVGESITSTIIEIDDPSKITISAVGNSGLFRLQLRGSTDIGVASIENLGGSGVFRCNEVRFGQNYTFYRQTSDNGVAISIFNSCSAESTSNFSLAFDISSFGSTPSTFALNSFIYTGNGSTFLKVNGVAAAASTSNYTISKTVLSGYGIHTYNGATVSVNSVTLQGFDKAIYNENNGSGAFIYTSALALRNNTTDIELLHPSTTGSITGVFTKQKVIIDPNISISLLFTDIEGGGTISLGELWLGNKYSEIYDVKPLIEATTLGLIEGGTLSDGGGFKVNVASGFGYLEDDSVSPDIYKRFDWVSQSITLTANEDTFIFINENGNLVDDPTRPSSFNNIILGRVVTDSSGILQIEQARFNAHHFGNRLSVALRNVFGAIFADGGGVVTSNTSREIEVLQGKYYLGEIEVNLNGKLFSDSFTPLYRSVSPSNWIVDTPTNVVFNDRYDDGSGTISPIPIGQPFVKHTLYATTDGINDRYFLIIGQGVFVTENDAINSPSPIVPTWFREHIVVIGAIITDNTDPTVATVIDLRPRPSFIAGAGTSVTSHSALSGLLNDDHPQYMLASGVRSMTGNLNMNTNNINNIGTLNGVNITAHASRHLPNGLDPLATAAPTTSLSGTSTNSVGTANSYSRSDHSHQIVVANTSTTGLLSSTDWNTFNDKADSASIFVGDYFDYNKLPNYHIENFLENTTGFIIGFSSSTGSGGSLSSEIPEVQANWNGTTALPRLGQASVRISTASNSRAGLGTNFNYRLFSNVEIMFSCELSILGGQINFVTDPVLQCWGLLDTFAAIPTNAIYFRPPRVGETSFLKFVVRVAGVESITNTTIVYDSTARRFVKSGFFWNGVDMQYMATDGTTVSVGTINNFLTTYPSLSTLNFSFAILQIRAGAAITGVSRNINVDKVERYISTNY